MSTIATDPTRSPFLTVAQAAYERAVKVGGRIVRILLTDLDDLLRPARVVPRLGRR